MTTLPPAARTVRTAALLAVGLALASATLAAPPADLDRYAKRVMDTFEVPGMVVTIVERGKPPIVRPYGVRRLGEPATVDDQTLFAIGSTTKAFTSTLIAQLVDEGKLTWDTKVADVLPGFRLYDPYASSEATIRDILTHRTGLKAYSGDLLFFPPTDFTRAEVVHKLRYLKPGTSFRSTFAYDNLMYLVAGQLIESVTGSSWDDTLRQRIFLPLGMQRASASSVLPPGTNRAWPHARTSGEFHGDGPQVALAAPMPADNVAPAGSINLSGTDMVRWLEVQLGRGLDPRTGKRIYGEAQAREMWSPQIVIPISPLPKPLALAQPNFRAYALGWLATDYRGHRVVAHDGLVDGMYTRITILPDCDVAFAIMANVEDSEVPRAIVYHLMDHYLGFRSSDWLSAFASLQQDQLAEARDALHHAAAEDAKQGGGAVGPSLPLAKYAGTYRDDWYGRATIEATPAGLTLRFEHTPALSGPLEHVRYDTFRARWSNRALEDAYVTFAFNADGTIDRMTMQAVSPLADPSYDYGDLLFRPEPKE
jgi:CubicO group peptidase (beta-lactamase class C family)